MGAVKALTFMCHFYVLLLLFFPVIINGLKNSLLITRVTDYLKITISYIVIRMSRHE